MKPPAVYPRLGELGVALQDLADLLPRLPAAAMVIGGIAVIARGVPRTTRDIDVMVAAGSADPATLIAAFASGGFVPRIERAEAFARKHQVLLLRHGSTGIEVDVSLGWLSFELEAIAAAEMLSVGPAQLPVARPDDLVVYKAVAWRPQDQQDIERLLVLYGATMDLDRIRRIVAELAEALADPGRASELDRLIERARS